MDRLDYGIDAPGIVRGAVIAGAAALLIAAAAIFGWPGGLVGAVLAAALLVVACFLLGLAFLMVRASRSGKMEERERLLDGLSMTGSERVLDVGCGRGLMLVGAARRLKEGRAVGIDLWRGVDQSGNRPEATLANARIEGVADRVETVTADMRELPFGDASFEVVLSSWAVHNLLLADDRAKALAEMVRVLKPGGRLLLADVAHNAEYASRLASLGLAGVRDIGSFPGASLLSLATLGRFRPHALLARKPSASPA